MKSLFNSKKKKLLWLAVFILGVVVFAYVAFHTEGRNSYINIDNMSDRAKEFVEEEKRKSGSSWENTAFVQSEQRKADASPKRFTTQCMTIYFPYLSRNEHITDTPDQCKIEFRMQSPPARVVFGYIISKESLTENANVAMREKLTEEYIEEKILFDKWDESRLFYQKDGVVLFLKQNDQLITIGITEMIEREKLPLEMIKKIVEGVEVRK